MRPTLDDIICDPAMGSAGFIMEAAKYIAEHQGDELLNIDNRNRYRNEIFHGSDSDASMMRIGCMSHNCTIATRYRTRTTTLTNTRFASPTRHSQEALMPMISRTH